jgi:heme A synthase
MIYLITGVTAVVFFVLASINGVKRYVDIKFIQVLAKQHRVFGMLSSLAALIHMMYALSQGQLRPTGAITLLALILTGVFGMMFAKTKEQKYYIAHRVFGPLTAILIVVHIILNSSI